MNNHETRAHVAELFRRDSRRGTRVGVEHELHTVDHETGGAAPIDRIRAATRGAAYAEWLDFEPGGQVELSLPCADDAAAMSRQLTRAVNTLRDDCAAVGVALSGSSVDARRNIALQLTKPRYLAMQAHFDTVGPAGRRMMRRTTSTQICLDWWPGAAGLEQWRVLNLAGPFLAAAFARSVGPSSRLATWLAVDPGRTAFDDRLLAGGDPVGAYADFAAGATVFTTPGDVTEHLTTLFPPVRPRDGYLEVRFLDLQPLCEVERVATVLSALMYDDTLRARAASLLAGEVGRLAGHWHGAAFGDEDVQGLGDDLVALALGTDRVGAVA
jgi:gamma-glutamylcysteine synthetase